MTGVAGLADGVGASLALALVVGLFSILHCVGMCGGIIGALTFSLAPNVRQEVGRLGLYLTAFNLGRVGSYALAGALLGWLGQRLIAATAETWLPQGLRLLAALLLVGLGLHLAGWFPRFALIERVGEPLWRRLQPLARHLLPVRSLPQALAYGAVWGWLPCGLVYSMLLSAPAQGDPLAGALFMAAFGLGTLPNLVVTGLLAGRLQALARHPRLRQGAGLSVMGLGLFALVWQGSH